MTDVGSSLIYWDEKEVLPRGIFLTSSGSGGDRLLFWQSFSAVNDSYKYNLKKEPRTHSADCSSGVSNANNVDSTSSKGLEFVGSSTMEAIPFCPKFKSGSKIRGRKNSENPFSLSLISERTMFFNEGSFGNSPITGGLNPNFMGSADHISNFSKTSQSFPNRRYVKTSEVGNSDEDVYFCNSIADQESNEFKVLNSLSVNQPTNENVSENNIPHNSDFHEKLNNVTTMNPLEKLVQISSLCAELKSILDSICKTGHVNVKINKIYPVCFCLPHKAYCLSNNDGISRCMVAVRPMAIWNAMDKIRPYHALILLLRKSDLLKDYLPTDINPTLKDFVNALSPTISLYNLAQKFHSQSHCLNLALWLIYRGHALIVYPIVANNIYVLAPHSKAWFTPQLIGQFATSFPDVNFAELLTSFSTSFVLKDHFDSSTCNIDNFQCDADVQNRSSKNSWTNLPLTEKINLIAWLLRRRLIIQGVIICILLLHKFVTAS
ncbi:hypothetical protein MN116_003459 [Schistosoma mekongi]|uniref:GATOR complex protein NPRL3 n=1 Tax=Schistosoma mekongi TaxID=38744 RepID=A0AAE2D7B3_SCHME|nr:hypothetical protein MN116_003459 [Schistosoma mekongi]